MQQNTSFKLDRISIDDKFSPKTLNDNAAQVEAALNTMSTMMVAGDAALRTDLDEVDKRVTALEAKKWWWESILAAVPPSTIPKS